MRTITLFALLILSLQTFAQSRKVDTLYWSIEKKEYLSDIVPNLGNYLIKTYHKRNKRDYTAKLVIVYDNLTYKQTLEYRNNEPYGSISQMIGDSVLIMGQVNGNYHVGKWKSEFLKDRIEVFTTYDQFGKRVAKEIYFGKELNTYEPSEVEQEVGFIGQDRWYKRIMSVNYSVSPKKPFRKRTMEFQMLILDSGIIGKVDLIQADDVFSEKDIEEITKGIYLAEGFRAARIDNKPVHSNVYVTFTYFSKNYCELQITKPK